MTDTKTVRPCLLTIKSENQRAVFHGWDHFSQVVPASPMIGGPPAGQISYTLAIVELEDGTVLECSPEKVRFTDRLVTTIFYGERSDDEEETGKEEARP